MTSPTYNFFWSNTPMPWIRYLTLATFRKLNPTCDMRLYISDVTKEEPWDGHPQDAAHYKGLDNSARLNNLDIEIIKFNKYPNLSSIHTVDMCRWEVLAGGGVFLDMDILFMNPMQGFDLEFDGISHNGRFFRIGLISGIDKGFFEDVLRYAQNKMKHNLINNDYQTLGVRILYEMLNCHPRHAWRAIKERTGKKIVLIPMDWVHPLPPELILDVAPPSWSIGNHWYAGHATHRWHIDNLNEDNIFKYESKDHLTKACADAQTLLNEKN